MVKTKPYPYAGRDLFEEPENYFYAKCAERGFLQRWRESRATAREALVRRAGAGSAPSAATASNADGISLNALLREILAGLDSRRLSTDEADKRVAPFLRKYEVFKRLSAHYDANLRKLPQSGAASLETYLLFGQCLAALGETSGSLKYLSTLLKLCDALASTHPDAYTPAEASMAVRLFEAEEALVNKEEKSQ